MKETSKPAFMQARVNGREYSAITEALQAITDTMCRDYCKYNDKAMEQYEETETLPECCSSCPVTLL